MAESRLADRPAAFWDAVLADYRGTALKLREILQKHDLTQGEFNHARSELNWPPRKRQPLSRKTLINRLFQLLERMILKLETNMEKAGETEAAVLGQLVRSMSKLIEIETATNAATTPRQSKQMNDIRSKLVARIQELKRG